jgi:hypothetical protein
VEKEFFEEMDRRGAKNLRWISEDAISFVAYSYGSPVETSRILSRQVGANNSVTWRIR